MITLPHQFAYTGASGATGSTGTIKTKLKYIDENFAVLVSALKLATNGQVVLGATGATGP